ncbi:MAG TPA: baseplate J/gp47 family protein [Nevskia sp.]|jgi:hypothetical protein|nr:baseplate J/gp47 family protein [Nevskia sp.]
MSFITKNFASIVASMVNQMRGTQTKFTDFRKGALGRTLVEASAIEIDQLYQQMVNGLVDGIPAALYTAFNFNLLPPGMGNGIEQFMIPAPVGVNTAIPIGTQVTTTDGTVSYLTTAVGSIPAGQTSTTVPIQASAAGSASNVGSGQLTVVTNLAGVTATNPAPITNGTDAETDQQRKLRFNRFIASLSRGPLVSIQYGATTAILYNADGTIQEQVMQAVVVEPYQIDPTQPLGRVTVYIFNGGSGASGPLVALAQKLINGYTDGGGNLIEGYKGAGVPATVIAATLSPLAVDMTVFANNGVLTSAQQTALDLAVAAAINNTPISNGASLFHIATLTTAAQTVAGVVNSTPTTPANDFLPPVGTKVTAGALTFTPAVP